MAKILDFNSLQRPTLEITMKDADKTKFKLICPREGLIERLEAGLNELHEVLERRDSSTINATYTLAAELFSENDQGVIVTADDLRNKYNLGLEELVFFYSAYMDFINDIKNAKN